MAAPPSMLCPVMIGRGDEQATLLARLEATQRGHGGLVALVGEAGVGKSRLSRELLNTARERGVTVLTGRAVAGAAPVAYRPLTEAFLGAFRSTGVPEAPALHGFEGHLGRLVPEWRGDTEGGADESPVLLSEAVVRLLTLLAGHTAAVLHLEDLHWADIETLAVVEYLADALLDEPVLCVVTSRLEGASVDTLTRLQRHHDSSVIELAPLDDRGVRDVVRACLDEAAPPAEVVSFITAHSEGNPFLVEELLAGLVTTGALAFEEGWSAASVLTPTVPTDFAHSIRSRTTNLDPTTRRVLSAAAVLGRRFEWNLLPGVAEVDGTTVVDALRRAVDEQLIEVDGQEFRFRHMLTREAILTSLLPPERRDLAERARPAIERAHPGLPGPWCELAAELAETAGDPVAAAERLIESARRALAAAALATAEMTASRARALAEGSPIRLDADECFVQITALAGKPADAMAVGGPLLNELAQAGVSAGRRAQLLLTLARAAVTAGDTRAAADFTEQARDLVGEGGVDERIAAGIAAVAAHVALGEGDVDAADTLARLALEKAAATGQPAVECEALEVLGRLSRTVTGDDAASWFARAASTAENHGLTGWLLRARHELALQQWAKGSADALHETRELAARHGALVSVAVMDLALADIALANFDRDGCIDHAQTCADASQRYGLATLPVAELWLAGGHTLAGNDEEMDKAIERSLARDPDDPRILGDLWGRVRATRSIVRDERERVLTELDRMMDYAAKAPPETSIFPNRIAWMLLHTIDDDDLGSAAQAEIAAISHLPWWQHLEVGLETAAAITLGRQGRSVEAAERFAAALDQLQAFQISIGMAQYVAMITAEAQLRDGWGTPAPILRRAEAFFAERGYDLIARRCRVAMGQAGEKVPRRGRGETVVPEHLRAVGITSRENDVLQLIVEGRSNREIAEQLYLSPKTVERHVASLFDRTGIRNRTDLAAWVVERS